MKLADTMIEWTPATWTAKQYGVTPGRCYVHGRANYLAARAEGLRTLEKWAMWTSFESISPALRLRMLFIAFTSMTVRDGLAPRDVHEEFLVIDEYRRRISADMPGVQEWLEKYGKL